MLVSQSCTPSRTEKKLFYEGIFFKYPYNWDISADELPGESYSIKAEEGSNTLQITFTGKDINLKELIKNYYGGIDSTRFRLSKGEITASSFGKYNTLGSNFIISSLTDTTKGVILAFKAEEKNFLIVKKSRSNIFLNETFRTIEESFNIKHKIQAKN